MVKVQTSVNTWLPLLFDYFIARLIILRCLDTSAIGRNLLYDLKLGLRKPWDIRQWYITSSRKLQREQQQPERKSKTPAQESGLIKQFKQAGGMSAFCSIYLVESISLGIAKRRIQFECSGDKCCLPMKTVF